MTGGYYCGSRKRAVFGEAFNGSPLMTNPGAGVLYLFLKQGGVGSRTATWPGTALGLGMLRQC